MSELNSIALPEDTSVIGHVAPIIGRVARREVKGYFGFPLIQAGQTVTHAHTERALNLGRLFELIAATEEE